MYQYVSAVVKDNLSWKELDIAGIPLMQLYQDYADVRVVVNHFAFDEVQEFNINDLPTKDRMYPRDINAYLVEIRNTALPTYLPITDLSRRRDVEYRNASVAGYTLMYTGPNVSIPQEVPRTSCTDVLIQRDDTDYVQLSRHCLFTAGGYIHYPTVRSNGVSLRNALNTLTKTDTDNVGMINLGILGDITYMPITEDMVRFTEPTANIASDTCYVANTDINFNNYYVFIVIAGVLQPLDMSIAVSDNLLKIDFSTFPFNHAYIQGKTIWGLKGVQDVITEEDNEVIALLMSNKGVTSLLSDENSFFVLVEKHELRALSLDVGMVIHSGIRGLYQVDTPPVGILTNDIGEVAEFHCIPNARNYSVCTTQDLVPNYIMAPREQPRHDLTITTMKDNLKPYRYSNLKLAQYYHLIDVAAIEDELG